MTKHLRPDAMPSNPTPQSTNETRPKKKRPDGTDEGRYRKLEKLSYRMWAWKFLRRNDEFIAACKKVAAEGTEAEKKEIADRFGLKKFKPFNDAYIGHYGKPVFSAGSISYWTNCNPEVGQEEKKVRAVLKAGQVLIRFDLASAVSDPKVLETQLLAAKAKLEKCRKTYAEASHQSLATKANSHKYSVFGQFLRMLDSRANGMLQIDSGLLISPKKRKRLKSQYVPTSRSKLGSAISKKMDRAVEYTTHLYRSLAALKGRPKVKSVPLVE